MACGEFALIDRYFKNAFESCEANSVVLGIGDDAALLEVAENHQLVVSVDTLVSGVHFPENATPANIAERALRVNLSDLAAMAATPLWFTLALTLPKNWTPEAREDWVKDFSAGLFSCAKKYSCRLVGGDTTAGPLSITIQVMGQVVRGKALRRDGAQVGDFILVTHSLGNGAAALALLNDELSNELSNEPSVTEKHSAYLTQRFYRPEPRLAESILVQPYASSAIDVSDGLLADLQHICEASDVAAELDVSSLPLSPALQAVNTERARHWALTGGDDYELVFTVSPEHMPSIAALQATGELQATVIGYITAGGGVYCELNGEEYSVESTGFKHF